MADRPHSTARKAHRWSNLQRTAIHEAAHAVIGRVLRQTCGGATILADHESMGHALTADPHVTLHHWEVARRWRGDDWSSIMRGRIISFMAGREAEIEISGRCYGGDGDDRQQILLMADEVRIPGVDRQTASQAEIMRGWKSYERRLRKKHAG